MLRSRLMQSIGFHEEMHRGEDMLLFCHVGGADRVLYRSRTLCRYWLSDTSSTGMIVNQGGQDIVWLDVQIKKLPIFKNTSGV